MGSVPPIHGFGEEPYSPVIPSVNPPIQSTPSARTSEASLPQNAVIDEERLKKDVVYVRKVLDWILYRARNSFKAYQYAQAQYHYNQYFQYLTYYRGNTYYSSPVNYVPALFERAWASELQGAKQETLRQINAEIMKATEPRPELPLAVREAFIQQVTQQVLPSVEHPLIVVSPQTLQRLARLAQQYHQPELARRLLGLAQVLLYLEVYRTQRLAVEIEQEETGLPVPYSALPFGYGHFGVPVSPFAPQPPDMAQRIAPKTHVDPYYVDKVNRVHGVNKDPRDEENRRRRQRRADIAKGKPKKTRQKPQITI